MCRWVMYIRDINKFNSIDYNLLLFGRKSLFSQVFHCESQRMPQNPDGFGVALVTHSSNTVDTHVYKSMSIPSVDPNIRSWIALAQSLDIRVCMAHIRATSFHGLPNSVHHLHPFKTIIDDTRTLILMMNGEIYNLCDSINNDILSITDTMIYTSLLADIIRNTPSKNLGEQLNESYDVILGRGHNFSFTISVAIIDRNKRTVQYHIDRVVSNEYTLATHGVPTLYQCGDYYASEPLDDNLEQWILVPSRTIR